MTGLAVSFQVNSLLAMNEFSMKKGTKIVRCIKMESPQEYKKSFIIITPLQKPKNLKLIMINHVIYHVNHVIILTYEQAQQ